MLFVEENMIVGGLKGPRPAQKAKCIKTLAVTSRRDHAQSTSGRRHPRSEDPVRTRKRPENKSLSVSRPSIAL
jgi:hypothetical protein